MMSPSLVSATADMLSSETRATIRRLSDIYDFPLEEALDKLSLADQDGPPKKKTARTPETRGANKLPSASIPLPWCGEIMSTKCFGIRYNKGLFTQCINEPSQPGGKCSACSESRKRTICCGDVRDRSTEDWTDYKGRKPIRYIQIMKKLSISREQAKTEAAKLGWEIQPLQFEEPEPTRRGRPPKRKPLVANTLGTDMLDELVEGARNLCIEPDAIPPAPPNETRQEKMRRLFGSDSDDELEEIPTKPRIIQGVEYLFDEASNTAYDRHTLMKVGVTSPGNKNWITFWK